MYVFLLITVKSQYLVPNRLLLLLINFLNFQIFSNIFIIAVSLLLSFLIHCTSLFSRLLHFFYKPLCFFLVQLSSFAFISCTIICTCFTFNCSTLALKIGFPSNNIIVKKMLHFQTLYNDEQVQCFSKCKTFI